MTPRVVEPIVESDVFSREATIQEWPKLLLEEIHTHEVGHMYPDHALGRPSPILRMHGVNPLISVICSDNKYGVGRTLEDLPGQIFGLVAFGNLPFQIFI